MPFCPPSLSVSCCFTGKKELTFPTWLVYPRNDHIPKHKPTYSTPKCTIHPSQNLQSQLTYCNRSTFSCLGTTKKSVF